MLHSIALQESWEKETLSTKLNFSSFDSFILNILYIVMCDTQSPSHARLNIQYICNTSVIFRRCLCRSCSTLPYFEHIFASMAPISIANECFCSVFNVRPSLTPTIFSFRLFNYTCMTTLTFICGYSAQYIEFLSRSTLKLPEIKIIFSNYLNSTFFIESIKTNKQRESCLLCLLSKYACIRQFLWTKFV